MKIEEAKILVAGFENGTLPKELWSHQAHFVMAFWYCYHLPLPVAIQSIKEGIKKYNVSTGGKNTDESGYHETITVFYIYAISNYILQASRSSDLESLLKELDEQFFLSKDFPMQYYTRELLMSKQARKEWIAPDRKSFCMEPAIVLNYTV